MKSSKIIILIYGKVTISELLFYRCDFIGAFANIGPLRGGRLVISGACLDPRDPKSLRLITHELFHSLGIFHHHERIDRDIHISINWFNIPLSSWLQFIWNPLYLPDGIPYDCHSLMHYDETAFAINKKIKTMTARNPRTCDLKSSSHKPTQADIQLLKIKYKCKKNKPKYNLP